jgi:peptidoglycan/LPS O-acetylase OafA/YrhL
LVIAGAGLLVVLTTLGFGGPTWRTLTWGVPAALVVAGATLGDFSPAGPLWRAFAVVGEASYALYLFHSFPVRAVTHFAKWSELDVVGTYWLLLVLAIAGAIATAIAIHYIFERPVTRGLRELIARSEHAAEARVATGDPLR